VNRTQEVERQVARGIIVAGAVLFCAGTLLYADQEMKETRNGKVKIENASASGNTITAVTGTGEAQDEKGATIAKGNLLVVEGWVALQCTNGTKFKLITRYDTDATPKAEWPRQPAGKVAAVTLNEKQEWELGNDNFFILMDTSYGVAFDWASSLARETSLKVPYETKLILWGNSVSVGKGGGKIEIVHGKITGGQNVTVTSSDGKVTKHK